MCEPVVEHLGRAGCSGIDEPDLSELRVGNVVVDIENGYICQEIRMILVKRTKEH